MAKGIRSDCPRRDAAKRSAATHLPRKRSRSPLRLANNFLGPKIVRNRQWLRSNCADGADSNTKIYPRSSFHRHRTAKLPISLWSSGSRRSRMHEPALSLKRRRLSYLDTPIILRTTWRIASERDSQIVIICCKSVSSVDKSRQLEPQECSARAARHSSQITQPQASP